MKKTAILISAGLFFSLAAGCSNANNTMPNQKEIENKLDPANNTEVTNQKGNNRLDYVRFSTRTNPGEHILQNRKLPNTDITNSIQQTLAQQNEIHDATVHIIDENVFVVYQKSKTVKNQTAADIIHDTVYAFLPQSFDIYISNNHDIRREVQQLQLEKAALNNKNRITSHLQREMVKLSN